MTSEAAARRPRLVVCEDGREYIERFTRFLGDDFEFVAAPDYAAALAAATVAGAAGGPPPVDGLLLDLDFRRTPSDRLVDERGVVAASAPSATPVPLDPGARRRLTESQGILILRQLRAAGVTLPAILFADLDDAGQARFLERTLAPLTIAPSRLGLREVAALMIERFVRAI